MDNETLQVILGRFDKLDEKIDGALKEQSALGSRVTAVETKVQPIVDDSRFKQRVQYAVTFAIAAVGSYIGIHFPGWTSQNK
jgi:hypothetical protein